MRAKPRLQISKHHATNRLHNESGIALITVLFLTILMSILGLTMVLSVNSDMLLNGYYGNLRGSYYAADGGINIARQYLINQIYNQVTTTPCLGWGPNASPGCNGSTLPLNYSAAMNTAQNNLMAAYGSYTPVNSSTAANSWPSSFRLYTNGSNCPTTILTAAAPIPTGGLGGSVVTAYQYTFSYTICASGTGASTTLAAQRTTVQESGTISLTVKSNDPAPPSFAGYGAFISNYNPATQGFLIPGTMTGPMWTNGAWGLGNTGPYIFPDSVGQALPKIDHFTPGLVQSTASSYPGINVNFESGLHLGDGTSSAMIQQPADSFSQAFAAIDGLGTDPGSLPSNAQLNQYMKDVNGNPYPSTGTSTGVFLPYQTGGAFGSGTDTGFGGGIYVQGSASVALTPGTDISGNLTQVYTITQGSTVTTVTTNPSTTASPASAGNPGTTTIKSGSTTKVLAGIPEDRVSNPGANTPGTMLYVNGSITGLTGPGEGLAAIQSNARVTVAAQGDIDITGDVRYSVEPVTLAAQTGPPAVPIDSLVNPAYTASATNTLGVFTSNGNIQLSTPYSDKNLWVDGSLAAVGNSCASNKCGFTVNGSINTFNNVGGQIQTNIFSANMNTENTWFDRRFKSWTAPGGGSFSPPWFPSVTDPGSYLPVAPTSFFSQQRTNWQWGQP